MEETQEITNIEVSVDDFMDLLDITEEVQNNLVEERNILVEEAADAALEDMTPSIPEPEVTLEPGPEEVIPKTLPENSATLKINEFTSRFNGAIWTLKANELDVVLAGCGGIGSWTGFAVS